MSVRLKSDGVAHHTGHKVQRSNIMYLNVVLIKLNVQQLGSAICHYAHIYGTSTGSALTVVKGIDVTIILL